jgi:hypothetical protein
MHAHLNSRTLASLKTAASRFLANAQDISELVEEY